MIMLENSDTKMIDLYQDDYYHRTTLAYIGDNNLLIDIDKMFTNEYPMEPFVVDNYIVVIVAYAHINNYIKMNRKVDFAFVENYGAPSLCS